MKKPVHFNDGHRYRICINELEMDDVKCIVITNEFIDDEGHYPPKEEILDILPWIDRSTKEQLGVRVYYRPSAPADEE